MTPPLFRVGLILTYRCNAECRHCFFECSPRRTEVMTRQTAQRAINEAVSLGANWVSFSGGEPFLEYDSLKELITLSSDNGLNTEVVSNGFWGETSEKAQGELKPLVEAGLDVLNLSVDDFHLEYVPFDFLKSAYWAAVELGVKIVFMVSTGKNSRINSKSLQERLEDDLIQVAGKNRILNPNAVLFENQFTPIGSGKDLEHDSVLLTGVKCTEVLRDIGVAPNGDVLPCCGPLGTQTVLGNINEESLSVILNRAGRDSRYKRIREGFKIEGRYSSKCHACVEN